MKKILIIDDRLPLLKKMSLKAAISNHPDMIFLDIRMPVMDGISMIEKLRRDKWGIDAAVMVLTNAGDSDSISASMNNNILKFYAKADWMLEDIIKEVNERLSVAERIKEANDNYA